MIGQQNKAPEPFETWVYYCPESCTGLRWLPGQKWRTAHTEAGVVNNQTGYAFLGIRKNGIKVYYGAHKIVWYLKNNFWPDNNQINHINRIRNDNKIENLELLQGTKVDIESIQKIDRKNIGEWPRYVSWNKRDKKFQGSVRIDGKRKTLGYSECPNVIHKKGITLTNKEHNRNLECEYVRSCFNCKTCPFLEELDPE